MEISIHRILVTRSIDFFLSSTPKPFLYEVDGVAKGYFQRYQQCQQKDLVVLVYSESTATQKGGKLWGYSFQKPVNRTEE